MEVHLHDRCSFLLEETGQPTETRRQTDENENAKQDVRRTPVVDDSSSIAARFHRHSFAFTDRLENKFDRG